MNIQRIWPVVQFLELPHAPLPFIQNKQTAISIFLVMNIVTGGTFEVERNFENLGFSRELKDLQNGFLGNAKF